MVKVDTYQVDIVDTVSVHMDMDTPDTAKIIPDMAMKIKSKSKKALTKKMTKDLVVKMNIAIQKGLDMVMVDMDMMDTVMVETDMDMDTVDLIMVQVDMADTVTETMDMDKDTMNTTVDMA